MLFRWDLVHFAQSNLHDWYCLPTFFHIIPIQQIPSSHRPTPYSQFGHLPSSKANKANINKGIQINTQLYIPFSSSQQQLRPTPLLLYLLTHNKTLLYLLTHKTLPSLASALPRSELPTEIGIYMDGLVKDRKII